MKKLIIRILISLSLSLSLMLAIPAIASASSGLTVQSTMEKQVMKTKNAVHSAILACASVTASANGTGIDVSGFVGDMKVTLDSSAGGGADHTLNTKLQESDDNVTFTDVVGGGFTQVTNAAASFETLTISADGLKKYIRGVDTVAGTSPVFARSLSLVGEKQYS